MPSFELFPVHRMRGNPLGTVLPEEGTERFDPILVFHEQGPIAYHPQEAVGFPNHPHRGFETVTYVVEGEQYHRDSYGHEGVLQAGDVQWMTAGAGIFHSELPTDALLERGGRVHTFQIWLNLPARLKMSRPRYQELTAQRLPVLNADGAWARVIAGAAAGVASPVQTVLPTTIVHVRLDAGASLPIDLPVPATTAVYAMRGAAEIEHKEVRARSVAVSRDLPQSIEVRAHDEGFEAMIVSAQPLGERVVSGGPFVMNSEAEIRQAYEDLRSGRFGTAAEIVH